MGVWCRSVCARMCVDVGVVQDKVCCTNKIEYVWVGVEVCARV